MLRHGPGITVLRTFYGPEEMFGSEAVAIDIDPAGPSDGQPAALGLGVLGRCCGSERAGQNVSASCQKELLLQEPIIHLHNCTREDTTDAPRPSIWIFGCRDSRLTLISG